MTYLADTNILVDYIRGKGMIEPDILKKGIGISIITYGELLYGAEKSVNREKSMIIIEDCIETFSIQIVNLDEDIMSEYAGLKATLEISGMKLHEFDLLIAATAKKYKLTLLTRNTKHFGRIKDLKIIN